MDTNPRIKNLDYKFEGHSLVPVIGEEGMRFHQPDRRINTTQPYDAIDADDLVVDEVPGYQETIKQTLDQLREDYIKITGLDSSPSDFCKWVKYYLDNKESFELDPDGKLYHIFEIAALMFEELGDPDVEKEIVDTLDLPISDAALEVSSPPTDLFIITIDSVRQRILGIINEFIANKKLSDKDSATIDLSTESIIGLIDPFIDEEGEMPLDVAELIGKQVAHVLERTYLQKKQAEENAREISEKAKASMVKIIADRRAKEKITGPNGKQGDKQSVLQQRVSTMIRGGSKKRKSGYRLKILRSRRRVKSKEINFQ